MSDKSDKAMTKAARERHLTAAGLGGCPYCKAPAEGVEYYLPVPVEDGSIEQKAQCHTCGRRWLDVFRLADVRELAAAPGATNGV